MNKSIYDLELFEVGGKNDSTGQWKRVPGGWIYRQWDRIKQDYYPGHGVFVPYNDEFNELEKVD